MCEISETKAERSYLGVHFYLSRVQKSNHNALHTDSITKSDMRSLFQSRHREPAAAKPVQAARPMPQAAAISHPMTRAELDDGVTVSELSELEARALCAREGITFFWPMREPAMAR
ncbi:hypothetical protein QTH91_16565 [Variovorax dokdonensis]|uniref:Uncharacterized protein n=1 Tax=Variovorax dokdonensis TaxID=344883 RepID=A0ABT7NE20_9BURK|nr:hypothetical protein [Variovorax dokdonensis]MDM0046105.1 hypothetical protein [Variovorax dokdonensis]